jgi:hypothetical protein
VSGVHSGCPIASYSAVGAWWRGGKEEAQRDDGGNQQRCGRGSLGVHEENTPCRHSETLWSRPRSAARPEHVPLLLAAIGPVAHRTPSRTAGQHDTRISLSLAVPICGAPMSKLATRLQNHGAPPLTPCGPNSCSSSDLTIRDRDSLRMHGERGHLARLGPFVTVPISPSLLARHCRTWHLQTCIWGIPYWQPDQCRGLHMSMSLAMLRAIAPIL